MTTIRARCAACSCPLTIEQRRPYDSLWSCECPDCADGEPDGETGVMMPTNTIGTGKTPADAFENYADICDRDPADLLIDGAPASDPDACPDTERTAKADHDYDQAKDDRATGDA